MSRITFKTIRGMWCEETVEVNYNGEHIGSFSTRTGILRLRLPKNEQDDYDKCLWKWGCLRKNFEGTEDFRSWAKENRAWLKERGNDLEKIGAL